MNSTTAMLAEIAIKSTFLLGAVAVATLALRNASASLRHLLWSSSLVALLAVPALAMIVPRWELDMFAGPAVESITPVGSAQEVRNVGAPANEGVADPEPLRPASSLPTDKPVPAITPTDPTLPASITLASSLMLIWIGGVAAGLITILGGMFALRRLVRNASPIQDQEWTSLTEQLTTQLGITRDVRLLRSDFAFMPATWGLLRPVILLPSEIDSWSDDRRRVVLLHELAHVRRNDSLTQLIAQLCCAVYWFHPAMWYAAQRLRAERELACDEHVLGIGVDPCDYAAHLLEVARRLRNPAAASIGAIAMARPSQLEGRLHKILNEENGGRVEPNRRARALAVAAVAIGVLPLAAMQPWTTRAPAPLSVVTAVIGGTQAAAADTFRWKGAVPAGKWIEILSAYGNITARPAAGRDVELIAIRRSGDARSFRIGVEQGEGVRFCAVSASVASDPCGTDVRGRLRHQVPGVRVDYIVRVPAGVGIAAHTGRGHVTADSMKSYVWATTHEGNIDIVTSDLAEASAVTGSISAAFGRRSWKQNLEFYTESGSVTVVAPSDATMMVEAISSSGKVTSQFGGTTRREGAGERNIARLGNPGRGMLSLRTANGSVNLRRGRPAVGEVSDMDALKSSVASASTDPKPNPNPNPEYDPDPNINADVDVDDRDNPTGERFPVDVPRDLISRFNDGALRGAPDARAIARLRNIAASHVKKHQADLVKERAEWALTLVRNGSLIAPLRGALQDPDWRVRAYAAWAIAETRDPATADALIAALGDRHWRVRMHAAAGLQRISTPRAVDPLIGALADEHWQVRVSAVDALAAIGDRSALSSLSRIAATDPHSLVREEARSAVERIR